MLFIFGTNMPHEKQSEWWEKDVRRLFHGVWAASPWNEERMTDSAIEVLSRVFVETERRVIASAIVKLNGIRCRCNCECNKGIQDAIDELKKQAYSN